MGANLDVGIGDGANAGVGADMRPTTGVSGLSAGKLLVVVVSAVSGGT